MLYQNAQSFVLFLRKHTHIKTKKTHRQRMLLLQFLSPYNIFNIVSSSALYFNTVLALNESDKQSIVDDHINI